MIRVELGKNDLLLLIKGYEHLGPAGFPGYETFFVRRPFINGDHWRVILDGLSLLSEEELLKMYQLQSKTIIQL